MHGYTLQEDDADNTSRDGEWISAPLFGPIHIRAEIDLSGTTDTFLLEVFGRLKDDEGNYHHMDPDVGTVIWSASFTADDAVDIEEDSVYNEWMLKITRTGSTDTARVHATIEQVTELLRDDNT